MCYYFNKHAHEHAHEHAHKHAHEHAHEHALAHAHRPIMSRREHGRAAWT
jgi:hypothetical protein